MFYFCGGKKMVGKIAPFPDPSVAKVVDAFHIHEPCWDCSMWHRIPCSIIIQREHYHFPSIFRDYEKGFLFLFFSSSVSLSILFLHIYICECYSCVFSLFLSVLLSLISICLAMEILSLSPHFLERTGNEEKIVQKKGKG